MSRAVAEGCHLAFRIDDRGGTKGVECARGAQTRGHDAGTDITGADCAHHVVTAAGTDRHAALQIPCQCQLLTKCADSHEGRAKGGEFSLKTGRHRIQDDLGPGACADIKECRARGVAILHALGSGEPPVDVVVGKEYGGCLFPVPGFVLANPEDFRRGVTGQHGVAGQFDHLLLSTQRLSQFSTLVDRRGVAPELGRPDYLIGGIQQDESVLLSADADAGDFTTDGTELPKNLGYRGFDGCNPDGGILLHGTFTLRFHKAIALLCAGQDFPRGDVEGHGFCTLGAAIDAEGDHGKGRMTPRGGDAKEVEKR